MPFIKDFWECPALLSHSLTHSLTLTLSLSLYIYIYIEWVAEKKWRQIASLYSCEFTSVKMFRHHVTTSLHHVLHKWLMKNSGKMISARKSIWCPPFCNNGRVLFLSLLLIPIIISQKEILVSLIIISSSSSKVGK